MQSPFREQPDPTDALQVRSPTQLRGRNQHHIFGHRDGNSLISRRAVIAVTERIDGTVMAVVVGGCPTARVVQRLRIGERQAEESCEKGLHLVTGDLVSVLVDGKEGS